MPVTNFTSDKTNFTWLDIVAPTKEELFGISEKYHLHQYALRDCLEPDHLPKHEDLGGTDFIITRMLTVTKHDKMQSVQEISTKVAIFYNDNLVITIHRLPHDFLNEIKEMHFDTCKCHSTRALVTKILWHVLHSYDSQSIHLSNEVDRFESKIFVKSENPIVLEDLYYIRSKASMCKKLLVFTGEVINSIRSTDNDVVALQDIKDLHLKLVTIYGQVYEDVTNLLNIYISLQAQKTNDVMKVLTIFSVFFMPLTFIAGIYGMNFKYMPELEIKYGYHASLLAMVVISITIFFWFKRKRWL
jgi:magnesium transporter